jgi:uncharacterized membrane protein YczE
MTDDQLRMLTIGWLSLLVIGLVIGCYFWYTRATDQTSKIFAVIVPLVVIPIWLFSAMSVNTEETGGRRKRKLR